MLDLTLKPTSVRGDVAYIERPRRRQRDASGRRPNVLAGVPVCPHAGGVGLCEAIQHLSMFDYVAVSSGLAGRRIESVDHLHQHLATPVELRRGRYVAPLAAGAGTEILEGSLIRFAYPDGAEWRDIEEPGF